MKKIIALVLCLVMVFALCACGESNTATTAPAADTATEAPAEEPAAAGSVYYLNFKPEADEAWQALAKTYTEQTGVPVTVVTAAAVRSTAPNKKGSFFFSCNFCSVSADRDFKSSPALLSLTSTGTLPELFLLSGCCVVTDIHQVVKYAVILFLNTKLHRIGYFTAQKLIRAVRIVALYPHNQRIFVDLPRPELVFCAFGHLAVT